MNVTAPASIASTATRSRPCELVNRVATAVSTSPRRHSTRRSAPSCSIVMDPAGGRGPGYASMCASSPADRGRREEEAVGIGAHHGFVPGTLRRRHRRRHPRGLTAAPPGRMGRCAPW